MPPMKKYVLTRNFCPCGGRILQEIGSGPTGGGNQVFFCASCEWCSASITIPGKEKDSHLSDYDIDSIIDSFAHAWLQTKGMRGDARRKQIETILRSILRHESAGLMRNVCHECLGSGYQKLVRKEQKA